MFNKEDLFEWFLIVIFWRCHHFWRHHDFCFRCVYRCSHICSSLDNYSGLDLVSWRMLTCSTANFEIFRESWEQFRLTTVAPCAQQGCYCLKILFLILCSRKLVASHFQWHTISEVHQEILGPPLIFGQWDSSRNWVPAKIFWTRGPNLISEPAAQTSSIFMFLCIV